MGLRAGGALGGAGAGAGRGAPEGSGASGGAQGGSIHSGCIAAVHNVPLSVLIRPLPSVLDPAKVQSLVDTIRVRPGEAAGRREGREARRTLDATATGSAGGDLGCVTLSKRVASLGQELSRNRDSDLKTKVRITKLQWPGSCLGPLAPPAAL